MIEIQSCSSVSRGSIYINVFSAVKNSTSVGIFVFEDGVIYEPTEHTVWFDFSTQQDAFLSAELSSIVIFIIILNEQIWFYDLDLKNICT